MSSHFLARKFQDFQRQQSAKPLICPLCSEEPVFPHEIKLREHAKDLHPSLLDANSAGRDREWRTYIQDAAAKAYVSLGVPSKLITSQDQVLPEVPKDLEKSVRKAPPSPIPQLSKQSSDDSMKLNVGEDVNSRSPSSIPLPVGAVKSTEKRIGDIGKLSLDQHPELSRESNPGPEQTKSPPVNKLKRAAGDSPGAKGALVDLDPDKGPHRNRKAKALSGGSFTNKDLRSDRTNIATPDPDFSRNRPGPQKRLFDPNSDSTPFSSSPRRNGQQDQSSAARHGYDPRTHVTRSRKEPLDCRDSPQAELDSKARRSGLKSNANYEKANPENEITESDNPVGHLTPEYPSDPEPKMVRQPETRPISHEQLVVEVKGIYAGLLMVEAKCIDVDEKQSKAAQEKESARQTKLTNEQWQALIALHKTLLHEHHDFFLASQHPSASPQLSRLAAKYSMPARMWKHGIHAFLEVLRHRLPDSLDHMLAFIYIAYSMMALLYETVPTFVDTWIECLGDLGRYRMAIEDDDPRDREVWSGVARLWYSKAAYKSPNIGRLYHHLAILARPYTLQQLSFYLRSLTCIQPFESARGSIMTLINPVLENKESINQRSSSMERIFIKAHGILFTERSLNEFFSAVRLLLNSLLENHIIKYASKFKEQGVFAAISNIAALFEYGALKSNRAPRSILRLAFEEDIASRSQSSRNSQENPGERAINVDDPSLGSLQDDVPVRRPEDLTSEEVRMSSMRVSSASYITFGTFSVALRRFDDQNVFPLVHVYFVFIHSLVNVEKAMVHLEREIPWDELCSFLNTLATPESITAKVLATGLPRPDEGVGRPLPEDFVMRGQLWSESYFPYSWFEEAMIDDDERSLELPSMAAPRAERILWLGLRIASHGKWIHFNKDAASFSLTQYTAELPKQERAELVQSATPRDSYDSVMSGPDEGDDKSLHVPDSPPKSRDVSVDSSRSDRDTDSAPFKGSQSIKPTILARPKPGKSNNEVDMTDIGKLKPEKVIDLSKTLHPDSKSWLEDDVNPKRLPLQKDDNHRYSSDPRKLEAMNILSSSSPRESPKI